MQPLLKSRGAPGQSDEELAAFDVLTSEFTIVEGFEDAQGKFAAGLGNVALIDCHYMDEFALGLRENTM